MNLIIAYLKDNIIFEDKKKVQKLIVKAIGF